MCRGVYGYGCSLGYMSVHVSINTPSVRTAVIEFVKFPLTDQVVGQRFGEELEKNDLMGMRLESFFIAYQCSLRKKLGRLRRGWRKVEVES